MTLAQAVAKLERMVANESDADCKFTPSELEAFVTATSRATVWTASTAYAFGARVVPPARNGRVFRCVIGGTTGTTEPDAFSDLSAVRGQIEDGGCVWADAGPMVAEELYDLRAAACAAWTEKAAYYAAQVSMSADGVRFDLSDRHKAALRMARTYAPVVIV